MFSILLYLQYTVCELYSRHILCMQWIPTWPTTVYNWCRCCIPQCNVLKVLFRKFDSKCTTTIPEVRLMPHGINWHCGINWRMSIIPMRELSVNIVIHLNGICPAGGPRRTCGHSVHDTDFQTSLSMDLISSRHRKKHFIEQKLSLFL